MARIRLDQLTKDIAGKNPQFAEALEQEREHYAYCRQLRERLRELREAAGVSQAELAKRMDMTQAAVSKIETGSGDIGMTTVSRYCAALNVQPRLSFDAAAAQAGLAAAGTIKYRLPGSVTDREGLTVAGTIKYWLPAGTVYASPLGGAQDDSEPSNFRTLMDRAICQAGADYSVVRLQKPGPRIRSFRRRKTVGTFVDRRIPTRLRASKHPAAEWHRFAHKAASVFLELPEVEISERPSEQAKE